MWQGLQADPLDCRRLAVSSAQGGLALLALTDPGADRVEMRQYRVNVGPGERQGLGGRGCNYEPKLNQMKLQRAEGCKVKMMGTGCKQGHQGTVDRGGGGVEGVGWGRGMGWRGPARPSPGHVGGGVAG